MDDGLVTMQAGQWHYPEVESVRLPQSIYDAVERRIHYLNAETRDVLSQASGVKAKPLDLRMWWP